MSFRLRCPACDAPNNVPDDFRSKTIRCGRCRESFPTPALEAPRAPLSDPEPVVSDDDLARDLDLPRRSRRHRRSRQSAREPAASSGLPLMLWIGLGGAVIVGLIILVGGGLFLFLKLNQPAGRVADPIGTVAANAKQEPAALADDGDEAREDDHSLPQDQNAIKARRNDRAAWCKLTYLDPYERIGRKNPKWDAPARQALEAAVRRGSRSHPDWSDDQEAIALAAKQAVDAGCDDALIRYLNARYFMMREGYSKTERERLLIEHERLMTEADEALKASRYPACRKANGLLNTAASKLDLKGGKRGAGSLDLLNECCATLPEVLSDKAPGSRKENISLCYTLLGNYRHYQGGREAGWKRVDAVLANHPDLKSVRLLMKARFHLDHGWEVRGNEFANAVPDEAIDVFHRQLELAGDAAAEAWRLDPTDPHGPMILIEVCKGLGLPRPTMELWFRRAMRADGDNLSACLSKLDYLEPKWHGSEKEMFEFARQCFATQNWEGGLPFALIQAHRSTATCRRADKGEYYKQPEVWKDIKAVCEGHLAASGHSRHELCVYASWAHECSDFATADKLFDEIGDRFSPDVFGKEEYQAMRDDSKKQAQGK